MPAKDLIFDVGMHLGQDTAYYLASGYRVVAIDADPNAIASVASAHAAAVENAQLFLVNCALGVEGDEIDFHLSDTSVWNSINKEIADRTGGYRETIRVPVRDLPSLFVEYGVPVYCKIDIEGYDLACTRTLQEANALPTYISVESECLGAEENGDDGVDELNLATLDELQGLGYKRFKLVDQRSLGVLTPHARVYRNRPSLWERVQKRLRISDYGHWEYPQYIRETRKELEDRLHYAFPEGSSGTFGESLSGDWMDYPAARQALLRHRRDFFALPAQLNMGNAYDFWVDVHATL